MITTRSCRVAAVVAPLGLALVAMAPGHATSAPVPQAQSAAGGIVEAPLGAVAVKARASSSWSPAYAAARAIDGDESSRWSAARDARSGWLEIDLQRETRIDRVMVKELRFPRIQEFAIEYKVGDRWHPLHRGSTIAGEQVYRFTPVEARHVRLQITRASGVPSIEEFHALAAGASPPMANRATAGPTSRSWLDSNHRARLRWFQQAKYGLFINWGLYSIPAGEWKGQPVGGVGEWIMNRAKIPVAEYEQLARRFNPGSFDAEAWAQLAVDAGMKYVVFDCKHHDGFALYRSRVSTYNSYDATPWKRDPFKELQVACAKRGLTLGFYYSHAQDWHHPHGAGNNWDFGEDHEKDFDRYLSEKAVPQVRELLTGYGPIGLVWFDTPRLITPARAKRFAEVVRSIQPDTLINSRLILRGGEIRNLTAERRAEAAEVEWDYVSRGDNEIPAAVTPGPWETAGTINHTWGFKKNDHAWKTPEEICFKLVDIVSKGGNYLLNVGPDADGVIPHPSQAVLRRVGAWLKVNGEAIYDAGPSPFGAELAAAPPIPRDKSRPQSLPPKELWRCTTKPGKIYLHFFQWPGSRFGLAGVSAQFSRAYLLADPDRRALPLSQHGGELVVQLPPDAPDSLCSVLCLETKP